MHAEEEAGSFKTICQARGLTLKVREGFPKEEVGPVKEAFQRFAEKIDYAAFQKELLRRVAESLGLTKEVLDRKASNADSADHVRQADPKRPRRRRARWG